MANQPSPPLDPSSPPEANVRKRVCKACDRCRLKKSKCDGGNPCGRCKADNTICAFGERKKAHDKVYPKGYVEMLEQQQTWLVTGLQELYRRTQDGDGWPGSPLKETNGHPLTHDILQRLGALKHESNNSDDPFEEDFNVLQQRLFRDGAGKMQRQDSSDGSSESGHSPTFQTPKPMMFGDPLNNLTQLPPTPRSSYSPNLPAAAPVRENLRNRPPHMQMCQAPNPQPLPPPHMFLPQQPHPPQQPALQQPFLQRPQPWAQVPGPMVDENMDFINRGYEPSNSNFDSFHQQPNSQTLSGMPPVSGLNSCLPMRQDWGEDLNYDDFLNSDVTSAVPA